MSSTDSRRRDYGDSRNRDRDRNHGEDRNRGSRDHNRRYDNKDNRPLGQVSEHAAMCYPEEKVIRRDQLPVFLQSGLKAKAIDKWRNVQEQALPLLTEGKDVVIISPAGSGKSTLLTIAALYRLYVKKDPAHILIICGHDQHCSYMQQLIQEIGKDVPDLNVKLLGERREE
ncbi:hypothetical protein RFI_19385, partial [Reticulomyxa filosa]